MMVSTAMAVLPVWRSPMMSSRWPRPMGMVESMALMPVCTGSCTDLRAMMPGALISILRDSLVSMGPLPSMGWPSASTTRPMSASPTGNLRNLARALDHVAFANGLELAEECDADVVLFEVEHQADDAFAEVEQLAGHGVFEAVDAGDAVAGFEHGAGFGHRDFLVEALDLLADDLTDFFSANLHVVSLQAVAMRSAGLV
jgi:hypothetical protein